MTTNQPIVDLLKIEEDAVHLVKSLSYIKKLNQNKHRDACYLLSMVISKFVYGSNELNNKTDISHYRTLSSDEINMIELLAFQELAEKFVVLHNTSTDYEGCSYNSIVLK